MSKSLSAHAHSARVRRDAIPPAPSARSPFFQLLHLAAPLVGFNLLSMLSLTIDTVMAGSLPNAALALTALGFATQIVFLMTTAMMGLSIGAVTLISQAYGARETARVSQLLRQAMIMTAWISLTIAVAGNLLSPALMSLLGAKGAVLQEAMRYARPLLAGAALHYFALLFGATMRGVGNTWWPFGVGLVANLLNVLFNYGLILGHFGLPQLGVAGAAYGTLLSHAFSVVALGYLLARGSIPSLRLELSSLRIDPAVIRDVLRISTPAMFDYIVLNMSYLSVIGFLGHIDDVAVAAHGVGMRVQLLAFIPALSISQATAALVGQHIGAQAPAKARSTVKAALLQSLALMTMLPLSLLLFGDPILRLFGVMPGSQLAELSFLWMTIMGLSMPILGTNIVFVGMMQGAGITLTSLKINAFATLFLQLPFGWVVGFLMGLGPLGIWLSIPVGFGVRAALGAGIYLRGEWLSRAGSTPG